MEFLEVETLTLRQASARGSGWWPRPVSEPLLADLSFGLEKRRSLSLVGDSREALLALALALVKEHPVASGTITFAGIPVQRFGVHRFRPVRRRIQAVFSDATGQLTPGMTVRETFREVITLWHRRASREDRAKLVEAVMISCALPEAVQDLYPAELDAVERQLVALARVLLPGPELLISAGFTEGLDVVQRAELTNRLRQVREEFGLTLLHLCDDLAEAALLGDDIGVLHRGRLVERGVGSDLVLRPAHERTRQLVAAAA